MKADFWRHISLALLVTVSVVTANSPKANAENSREYTVFDVRKTLPLNDEQKIFKDYYVNMGTDAGVKVGSILAVYRRVPVIDIYRNKAQGDLVIPIGHIKIIHVQKTMSVGRLESTASGSQIPVVEFETVMMGDQVQLAASSQTPKSQDAKDDDSGDDGGDDGDNSGTANTTGT